MSVEIFGLIGQKLVQTQSDKLKAELVEVNAPTVSEVFLGIGNNLTSLVSTHTLIYKLYSIFSKYSVAVSLTAHDYIRALLTRGRIPRGRAKKTDGRCAVVGVG